MEGSVMSQCIMCLFKFLVNIIFLVLYFLSKVNTDHFQSLDSIASDYLISQT